MIGELLRALFAVLVSITQVMRELLCEFFASAFGGVAGIVLYSYLGSGSELLAAKVAALAAAVFYLFIAARVNRELQYGWFKRGVHSLVPALGTFVGIRLGVWCGFSLLIPLLCVLCTDAILVVVYNVRNWLSGWLPRT